MGKKHQRDMKSKAPQEVDEASTSTTSVVLAEEPVARGGAAGSPTPTKMKKKEYEKEMRRLQGELGGQALPPVGDRIVGRIEAGGVRHQHRRALLHHGPDCLDLAAGAVAGNLAWQADAFQASPSLRRANLYLRLSRDLDAWQPSLDLLWQGADGGRVLTAALLWKGDRVQWQGGARVYGGPAGALLAQLPTRRQATLTGTLAF